jgi:hypothetical protein
MTAHDPISMTNHCNDKPAEFEPLLCEHFGHFRPFAPDVADGFGHQ